MKKISDNRGTVIVEATFVFPIMFFVIFIMMVAGNAYFQKCRVENLVNKCAIDGAAYCADPLLEKTEEGKSAPSAAKLNVQPYRYITGGMKDIVSNIEERVTKEIKGLSTVFFWGMEPKNKGVKAKFNNHILYATFSLEVKYEVIIPIRYLFDNENMKMSYSTRIEVPVSDVPEFIRNVDMVEDYYERLNSGGDGNDKGLKERVDMIENWK